MDVTVLGSGSCIPAPNRGNPGYLVHTGADMIMLDGGAGALRQVANAGFDYRQISYICYTHLHPDHTFDFVPFLFALKNDFDLDTPHHVRVFAPQGFREYWGKIHAIYSRWIDAEEINLTISEHLAGEHITLDSVQISTGRTLHTEHSLAYRFEDPEANVLVYSGDTGYTEKFTSFARDADLLILECALPERAEYSGHLTPSQAGRIAEESRAGKTILTHFYPQVEREDDILQIVSEYYSGEVLIAEDCVTYSVTGS